MGGGKDNISSTLIFYFLVRVWIVNTKKTQFIFLIVMCLAFSASAAMGEGLTLEEYLSFNPPAPMALTATVIGNAVVLNWKPAPTPTINKKLAYDPFVDHYVVYRRKGGGNTRRLATTTKLVYEDTTAASDTVYFYSVVAVHKDGMESSRPDEVSVIVNPPNLEELVIKTPVIALGEIVETLYDGSGSNSDALRVSVIEVIKGNNILKEIEVAFTKRKNSFTYKERQQCIFFLRRAKGKYFIAGQPNHQGVMPVLDGEVIHGLSFEKGEKEELRAFMRRLKGCVK